MHEFILDLAQWQKSPPVQQKIEKVLQNETKCIQTNCKGDDDANCIK